MEDLMVSWLEVHTANELYQAVRGGLMHIQVVGEIAGVSMITLQPGMSLRGGSIRFAARGVRMARDNTLSDINLFCGDTEVALFVDPSLETLGTLTLHNVTTRGQIAIIAEGRLTSGHINADRVHVEAADVRARFHRPHAYGVDALQGAFTLWNRQPSPESIITAALSNLSAGSADEPVRGSGIFIAGTMDETPGGVVRVSALSTSEIHSDGGIAPGTADVISGGVFVVGGAIVDDVDNLGTTTTYGQNDMVLDNWGTVHHWTAHAAVTSKGPSGIGFVNFGDLGKLVVNAPLETYGDGARGFNLYGGTLGEAIFDSIRTYGDGAVGVQLSKPMPKLTVRKDLSTSGATGISLVKGVQTPLTAMALSIQDGGGIDQLTVGGKISTSGKGVTTVEVLGHLGTATIDKGIQATGVDGVGVRSRGSVEALSGIKVNAPAGTPSLFDKN
jgi:hypothetical protein